MKTTGLDIVTGTSRSRRSKMKFILASVGIKFSRVIRIPPT